jgi:hypothetical protein
MSLTHDIIYRKTLSRLNEFYDNNHEFHDIYINLLINYEACLIGGAIRDFCSDIKPKDLDFVINLSDKELFSFVSKYNYKTNKFGGYKVKLNDLYVDIWSIDNHWAFKNQIITKNIENIEYTTFYNFDSLVFNLSSQQLYTDCFLDGYKSKTLDITLDKKYHSQNPGNISNVYKALKLANDWGLNLSSNTLEYIKSWKDSCSSPLNQIKSYERVSKKTTLLSEEYLSYLAQL